MSGAGKWGDLGPRVVSGALLAAVGFAMIWFDDRLLAIGLIILAGLGVWELHRMLGGPSPRLAGVLASVGVAAVIFAQILAFGGGAEFLDNLYLTPFVVPFLGLALWGGVQGVPKEDGWIFWAYGGLYLFALCGLLYLKIMHGFIFVLFVVAIVVASDIAGYFVGRILGGPKFWPRVSPKKTWSGTVGGWFAAMAVALALLGYEPVMVFVVAPFLALAAQMGDIAESAIKRRVGVKDSSALIPGHGGVLDRFDAMSGAAAVATLAMVLGRGWLM